jgi:predicted Zn-dependent peptidase
MQRKTQTGIKQKSVDSGKVKFVEFNLSNGLKVILSKDSSIPSVAVNLCFHVGSKDEEPDKRGFAHFFEHLMFEGSKNVPAGIYDKLCVNAGGENNAYTTEDKTNYFILMPSNQLELALWLESDRMLGFAASEESFNTQKEVVREEKGQIFDNRPYGSLSLEFMPRLFKKSGYRWDTIGDMDDLAKASLKDAEKFYQKYYVPNNAVLTIVGDIEPGMAESLVRKYFGPIPKGDNIIKPPFEEEELQHEIKDTIYDTVQLPGIFIGYRAPAEHIGSYFSLDVLSDILATGESSRFYHRLVYEKQLCSDVGCYIDPKELAGVFYIYAILMPNVTVEEAENEIELIIEEVKNTGTTDYEIEKIKNKIEARYVFKKQTLLSKADLLSHYKTFFDNPGLIDTNILNYDLITTTDISGAAKQYLNKNNRVVLYYLPKKTGNQN